MRVKVGHVSMQFGDTERQKRKDVERMFARADRQDYWWLTGTEAGGAQGSNLVPILHEYGDIYGYRIAKRGGDSWAAVAKEVVNSGWNVEYEKIIDGKAGRYTDKGLLCVGFDNIEVGHVTVMTAHMLTAKADPSGALNEKMAKVIGIHAKLHGRKAALAFYGGDQNINDRKFDTFLGNPLTSIADETQHYENTGHGPIDVIASYDHDGRVTGVKWRVLDDSEFPLHTDHYLCEATYEITRLSSAA